MDVVIAGGHGQIALQLAPRLHERGDRVRALIRNPDHAADVRAAGAEPVVCDLEHAGADAVTQAIAGADAVVFAAGAGPGSGPERKWTMDHGGAVKLAAAAGSAGARRYVMVSSVGADPDADDSGGGFAVYLKAKGRADADVLASGLDVTIVRPGRLTNEPGTGRVRLGAGVGGGAIPREDVAAVLAAVLQAPATIGATFEVVGGDVPIADALGRPA
jgi:uncharacterized protein YbjT (DUF2867 family)